MMDRVKRTDIYCIYHLNIFEYQYYSTCQYFCENCVTLPIEWTLLSKHLILVILNLRWNDRIQNYSGLNIFRACDKIMRLLLFHLGARFWNEVQGGGRPWKIREYKRFSFIKNHIDHIFKQNEHDIWHWSSTMTFFYINSVVMSHCFFLFYLKLTCSFSKWFL